MNSQHYHEQDAHDPKSPMIEADGIREHCDQCRQKKGLKPLNGTERKMADAGILGVRGTEFAAMAIPDDEMTALLEESEAENDKLRARVRELEEELAGFRKGAAGQKRAAASAAA